MIPFLLGTNGRTRDTISQREEVMALFIAFCGEARTHAVITQESNETLREHCSGAAYAAACPSMACVCGLACLGARVQSRPASRPRGDRRTGRGGVRQRACRGRPR